VSPAGRHGQELKGSWARDLSVLSFIQLDFFFFFFLEHFQVYREAEQKGGREEER
jgi:hypothetical protein